MARIVIGDCREVLQGCEPESVDAVISDPPYGISFMGKDWDHGIPGVAFWREALRVAKPGAHLLAFGGTRTSHRLMSAIEDAGWELRDAIAWCYGSGFPKSLDVSKAIDRVARPNGGDSDASKGVGAYGHGAKQVSIYLPITAPATDAAKRWDGWGTALKPAYEPIVLARKPLVGTVAANVERFGTGAINVDGGRVGHSEPAVTTERTAPRYSGVTMANGQRGGIQPDIASADPAGRWPPNLLLSHLPECKRVGTKRVKGGTAIRERGVSNQIAYGGNIGRLPEGTPNLGYTDPTGHETIPAYDCAPGCPVRVMGEQSGESVSPQTTGRGAGGQHGSYSPLPGQGTVRAPGDTGTAARFFPQFELTDLDAPFRYCAKASRAEREAGCESLPGKTGAEATESKEGQARLDSPRTGAGRTASEVHNHHPTVKPVDLMRWLCRLVTPPGGLVLDPFCGSGSTGVGAVLEGFDFLGIELSPEYAAIARARILHVAGQCEGAPLPTPDTPRLGQISLFGGNNK